MDAAAFLDRVRSDEVVRHRVVHVERLPAREPEVAPAPGLPDPIPDRLRLLGIPGLYPHQRRALDLIERGRNVIVATGTASGKTLVYDLAFAKAAVADRRTTALLVFPTKALARDQLRQLRQLRLPQIRA
ncbi:MAG: DEAD/DEAH box helicase, partial [Actinomycetota bacterium]